MISSLQLRAARALLRWSAKDLSEASGIGTATIQRMEVMEGIPSGNIKTFQGLQKAFEIAGIDFVGSPETNPGVQLDTKKHQAYLESLK